MRTTIEIRDEYRARLLALAARRGMRGYSKVVEEALEKYLKESERGRDEDVGRLKGILTEKDAEKFRRSAGEVRKKWRS